MLTTDTAAVPMSSDGQAVKTHRVGIHVHVTMQRNINITRLEHLRNNATGALDRAAGATSN